ncbi:DMT family transporter [Roseobacter sp. HKCCD5988]|uniref:DMT family transporter n=1 Tax=Roseobacter sp. HKCCD5988 TaxID=3120338 RepID=UPI0030EE5AEE|nr:EamA family transporter [Rhodobacterales bacterium HKCCA1058]
MSKDRNSTNIKGALIALAAFGIYATHDVVIKYLGASYSVFQIVFFSVLFGFPVTMLLLMGEPKPETLRPKYPFWTALRSIAVVFTGATAFYAFSALPLTQTYAIIFAMPVLITLLAIPMLGERIGIRRASAVVLGLVGVLIVLRPGAADLNLGHLSALAAAFGGALVSVILRKIGSEERSVTLMLYPMMANFIVMGALLPFVYEPMPLLDMALMALVAILALLAMWLVILAYRMADAVIVAPMQYSQILWAVFFGTMFFGEGVDQATVIGAAVIITSGVYIVLREDSRPADSQKPVLRTHGRIGAPSVPRMTAILRGKEETD